MADEKPVIIIKKKGGHGGHHGGAWKVAYADFVTAMMAFFMVMWLVNSAAAPTKQAIASYFRKPGLFTQGSGTPIMIGEAGIMTDAYVPPRQTERDMEKQGDQDPMPPTKKKTKRNIDWGEVELVPSTGDPDAKQDGGDKGSDNKDTLATPIPTMPPPGETAVPGKPLPPSQQVIEQARKKLLQQALAQINQQIQGSPELKELLGLVDVKLEADGLLLEIMDTEKTSMFASGSARILSPAQSAFSKVAQLVRRIPSRVEIVGHTDATPFSSRPGGYSNWELSADRANAARRILEEAGVSADRIKSVVGKADRELKFPENSEAAGNRRITLKLKIDPTEPVAPQTGGDPVADDLFERLKKNAAPSPSVPSGSVNPAQGVEGTALPAPAGASGQTSSEGTEGADGTPTPVTVKSLIEKSKEEKVEEIPLAEPSVFNPEPKSKDKIFGHSPVFGPDDPILNLPR